MAQDYPSKSQQEAYEQAYYEAAGETSSTTSVQGQVGQQAAEGQTAGQAGQATADQSFADYVTSDAFQAATQNANAQGSAQGQPYASNVYQQPWNSGAGQASSTDSGYQQQYYYTQPQQSYGGYVRTKDHVAAGLLAIFLGSLGIHKFYLGYNTAGFIMLGATILGSLFTLGLAGAVMGIVALIEGIIYLTKNQTAFDAEYVYSRKEWF